VTITTKLPDPPAFPGSKISGKVDMVVRLYDKTDNGTYGSNNGVYLAGYQIYDSSGTDAVPSAYWSV
jgi:hypothetical protein